MIVAGRDSFKIFNGELKVLALSVKPLIVSSMFVNGVLAV